MVCLTAELTELAAMRLVAAAMAAARPPDDQLSG
jgi:hypothetical protein